MELVAPTPRSNWSHRSNGFPSYLAAKACAGPGVPAFASERFINGAEPNGTRAGAVTFAFTHIEGSTARWERNQRGVQDAVRRHDAILHHAVARHGGHVFKTIGDAFCSAFERPKDAVAAMLAAQHMLAAEDFSALDGLRVRAAIHTGPADARDGDCFGSTVNKVARLLAIGHGGQILLTAETAAHVDGVLPEEVSLRDLGAYHLKDFAQPQRVHQLLAPVVR
jgi:class 3 adenylate cyclase